MSVWRPQHGRKAASQHTLDILEKIERDLVEFGDPRPHVASIRIGAGMRDHYEFEVEIELVRDAVLAVRYQSVDEENPSPITSESGAVASLVGFCVKELHDIGFRVIADQLHELRVQARQTFEAWSAEGVHVQLYDIRLVTTEYWYKQDGLQTEVRFNSLNNRLHPVIEELEISDPGGYEAALEKRRPRLVKAFARQTALARQGADGIVGQLTLSAISSHGDVSAALRTIGSGQVYAPSYTITVYETDGYVRSHGWDPENPDFRWNRNSVIVEGAALPDTTLVALTGHPITDLVEHPVLSPNMIITRAFSKIGFGTQSIVATFTQPMWLFCSASGRVWQPDPSWSADPRVSDD